MSEDQNRAAIAQVARDHMKAIRKAGGSISYEQARDRVASAVRKGDAKRDNNHR